MFYVYIIESLSDHGWYIGFSSDLRERLMDHNRGDTISIAHRRPFILIYYEAYLCKKDATGRELFLKSGAGRRFLKKQLFHYLNKDNDIRESERYPRAVVNKTWTETRDIKKVFEVASRLCPTDEAKSAV
ncbi:MAG: GIY-YIG nuclease family protein [Patescibacteria group bacterium]|jgi:putative endonuclease